MSEENCSVTIASSSENREGIFHSPGYPNGYIPGIRCRFSFIANDFIKNERVQLEFAEFDIAWSSANENTYEILYYLYNSTYMLFGTYS